MVHSLITKNKYQMWLNKKETLMKQLYIGMGIEEWMKFDIRVLLDHLIHSDITVIKCLFKVLNIDY